MSESLSYRAAKYFGLHDEPRTSVALGDGMVAIIAERQGRKVLAVYEDVGWTGRGSYSLLTERQRAALVEALSA